MRVILAAAALGSVLALAAPANAQHYGAQNYGAWQSIDQRQDSLERRIDRGVRDGSLTRREAALLRDEFRDLERLEARYRRTDGRFTAWERADLDRRFDALSARIRYERHDAQNRGRGAWQSINQRQANLDARIDRGVRTGALTRSEAYRLRAEFRDIAQLESYYRRTGAGLSLAERRELDRRFDALSARIRIEVADNGYRRR
jgi:hypothetical protein